MKVELIELAKARVPSVPQLVNMVSRRVRQRNAGMRPYLKPEKGDERVDIALREIAEGKLTAEIGFFKAADDGSAAPSETP